jgi:hypothetical protein
MPFELNKEPSPEPVIGNHERGRPLVYPFPDMELGDTFYVDLDGLGRATLTNRLNSVRRYWERKLDGRRFLVRAHARGLRVQRIV